MAEAYHQYLENLSWWEQIDRFFNPSKYSCTISYFPDVIWHIFLALITVTIIISILLFCLYGPRKLSKKKFRYIGDDSKEIY